MIVIAKAPAPGFSKTRLCPPCSPEQAARLARAALRDTLDAVAAVPGRRRPLLVLGGPDDGWAPEGIEVRAQREGGHRRPSRRTFEEAGGPALLVGMNTPEVTARHVERGLGELELPEVDAAFGPAPDGGYWAVGLRQPDARVFEGVPMSTSDTGRAQLHRFHHLGMRVAELESLRDVDTIEDARVVASESPVTRFAGELAQLALAPI